MVVACGNSNNNPTPDGGGTGGSTIVTASSSSSSGSSSGGGSSATQTGGSSSSSSSGATCYDGGSPDANDQFINACPPPGETCQTFPASQLQGLTADGGLPPLPQ